MIIVIIPVNDPMIAISCVILIATIKFNENKNVDINPLNASVTHIYKPVN